MNRTPESTPHDRPDRLFRKRLALCILIGVVTLAAYSPAIRGGFIWDDDDYVTHNPHLRSAAGLARIWLEPGAVPQYYPLVHTSYWLEYQLWGLEPLGYHLGNVLLHLLAALLAWRVLKQLAVPGAGLAAALFALHPVHVESVAWITERKNVLSAVFYFGSALCFFRFAPPEACKLATNTARPRLWYASALVLFIAALLSKTVTASLPAAILLVHWWKTGRVPANRWKPLIAFFLLGIVASLHTIHLEKVRVGASGPDWDLSLIERCLIAGRASWFYLGKLAWPDPLIFFYPKWKIDAEAAWQYLYPAAALICLGFLWRLRGRIGRGPLAAALFFGGTLLPALGFFDLYPMRFSFVADHFQYLASLGPITLAAATATLLWRKLPTPNALSGALAATFLLLILAFSSHRQAGTYRDAETLWQRTIAANPQAFTAYHNLGTMRAGAGKYDEAVAFWQQAQAIHESAETCRNIGQVHELRGDLQTALQNYQRALELQPDYVKALIRAGQCYLKLNKWSQAEASLRQVLQHLPGHIQCRMGLGIALEMGGRHREAEDCYSEVLGANPGHADAHARLGMLLAKRNQTTQAQAHFQAAVRAAPDHGRAHAQLAALLWQDGRHNESIRHFSKATEVAPTDFNLRMHLCQALITRELFAEAAIQLRQATSMRPDVPLAWYLLGTALDKTGRQDEAISALENTLDLQPDHGDARMLLDTLQRDPARENQSTEPHPIGSP